MSNRGASRTTRDTPRGAPRAGGVRRRGMTLVELLVVMGLAALVMGFGVGALSSIDVGGRSAVAMAQSSLRSARNWSVARDAPSKVTIDHERGTIAAEGLAVIGTWHFEQDPPKGAFGLDGELVGGEIVDDGFLGRALSFVGAAAEAGYEVAVQKDPAFTLTDGFVIEFVARPESTDGGRILRLGGAVEVEAVAGGALKVEFGALRVDEQGNHVAAGKAILNTEPGVLAPNRWNRVMISYDRDRLRAFVEGIQVGELEESAHVAALDGMMIVGGGRRAWEGAIDTLVISAVAVSDVVELPEGAVFTPETPSEIAFWPGGGLDRTVHREPVEVVVEFDDGVRVPVRVGLYGNVE